MNHRLFVYSLIAAIFLLSLAYYFDNKTDRAEIRTYTKENTEEKENLFKNVLKTYNRYADKFKDDSIKVAFVGDIMLDRAIRQAAEKNSYNYIFENVKDKLNNFDLVIGNLEGPVTAYSSKTHLNTYIFTFDPKSLSTLFDSNIKIVSIDNNHILNFGKEGLNQTIENLSQNNIQYFGNPDKKEVLYKSLDSITLAFVSYNQFLSNNQTNKLILEAAKKSDWVIVYAHWGDEYQTVANKHQVDLAHKFVDNGADIVIGTHPHVIQNKEKYKGKWIYYSLGNFVFDQWFDEQVRCGAVVSFELEKNKIINIDEQFIYLENNGQTVMSNCRDEIVQ